jgi:protochlorophyllide reductase
MGFLSRLASWTRVLAVVVLVASLYISRTPFWRGLVPVLVQHNNFNYTAIPSLANKVALVTGANSGLGFSTAVALAENGAKVFLTCRSIKKCERAANKILESAPDASLVLVIADFSDLVSVQAAANQVIRETEQLDILVLNAGVMFSDFELSRQGLETHFAVNHVAHFYLTAKLTPLLRKSAPGMNNNAIA